MIGENETGVAVSERRPDIGQNVRRRGGLEIDVGAGTALDGGVDRF